MNHDRVARANMMSRRCGGGAVEISEVIDRPNPIHILVGERSANASIMRKYPLDYVVRGTRRTWKNSASRSSGQKVAPP